MSISLDVRYTKELEQSNLYSYGLLVEALASTDMSKKIFVIRRGVPSVNDSELNEPVELDEFVWIASPLELDQIPEDAPNLTTGLPYYRTDSVRFSFRSVSELSDTLNLIKQDIAKLVKALKREQAIEDVEDIKYE